MWGEERRTKRGRTGRGAKILYVVTGGVPARLGAFGARMQVWAGRKVVGNRLVHLPVPVGYCSTLGDGVHAPTPYLALPLTFSGRTYLAGSKSPNRWFLPAPTKSGVRCPVSGALPELMKQPTVVGVVNVGRSKKARKNTWSTMEDWLEAIFASVNFSYATLPIFLNVCVCVF